ncbi:MAG: hypothetical protein ACRD1I_04050 [Terriglobia bacterium]
MASPLDLWNHLSSGESTMGSNLSDPIWPLAPVSCNAALGWAQAGYYTSSPRRQETEESVHTNLTSTLGSLSGMLHVMSS